MSNLINDVKYAFRQICKNPGFAAVAVLILSLGIGANAAFFGVLNTTILRPLPYPQSSRLVQIRERSIKSNTDKSVSYPDFMDWKRMQRSFTALTIYCPESKVHLRTEAGTERVPIAQVDRDFLKVLGYQPALGRDFTADDDRNGAALTVLLTNGAWSRRFNCDPDVLGRTIQVDRQSATIIGILPAEFQFFHNCELLLPLGPFVEQKYMHMRESHANTVVIGRLRPDRSISAAGDEMDSIAAVLSEQYPKTNADIGVGLTNLHRHLMGNVRQQQILLMSAVGLVLLIVCVNIATLSLARSCSRNREMAVRVALGAGRGRLVRQMMVEHLLLAAIGGGLGLLLALGLSTVLDFLIPFQIRHLNSGGVSIMDVRVGIFTFIITILTGLGFGLIPAWRLSRASTHDVLKDRSVNQYSLGPIRTAGILVAAQVGLATILVISSGLVLRSLWSLSKTPLGYQAEKVLSLRLASPLERMDGSFLRAGAFYAEAAERLSQLPGVEAAAAVSDVAFGGSCTSNQFRLIDRATPSPSQYPSCRRRIVSRDYFRAMGILLLQGRSFDGREPPPTLAPGASGVSDFLNSLGTLPMDTVVTHSFAQHFWPGENPIGKRFMVGSPDTDLCVLTVIGVVGDNTQDNLAQTDHEEFYFSIRQFPLYPEFSMILRTRGDPSTVIDAARAELRKMTTTEPVYDVRLLSSRVAASISDRSFQTQLVSLFAGIALLLASVGVYGVLAFSVGRRTREIGIRKALGATPGHTIWNVFSHGFSYVLPGLVIGLLVSLALGRYIESQLYGVTVTDPLTYSLGSLTLMLAAILACWIPARRAAKIDPMEALRYE
ncbi:MAG: ABC transporter permease [Sedimentisphaerales bacterium]|nr:ABC transporter permease [Sedimentisphaerales bacterium]